MNSTVEILKNHRSIRAFKNKPIEDEVMKEIFSVANHTSTSMGLQSYSIIRITDKEVRDKISKICNQEYVNQASEFLLFIADNYRNASIAFEQGFYLDNVADADRFFQGYTDACLAAQNMMVAVESYGLGGVFFGSIMNNLEEIIRILDLPEYTFPVLGLGIGYPDQEPLLKPRMDIGLKVFENGYKKRDEYLPLLKDYDEEMKKYYDMRNPSKNLDEFTLQVVSILKNNEKNSSNIVNIIRKQGYDLGLEYIPDSEIRSMYKKTNVKTNDKDDFEEGRYGIRLDTNANEIFEKYPYIKSYILSLNPKFNKINEFSMVSMMKSMTIKEIADIGEMPGDSLIYMIESRIDEE